MYHLCTTATFPAIHHKRKTLDIRLNIKDFPSVGVTGFEPATTRPPGEGLYSRRHPTVRESPSEIAAAAGSRTAPSQPLPRLQIRPIRSSSPREGLRIPLTPNRSQQAGTNGCTLPRRRDESKDALRNRANSNYPSTGALVDPGLFPTRTGTPFTDNSDIYARPMAILRF